MDKFDSLNAQVVDEGKLSAAFMKRRSLSADEEVQICTSPDMHCNDHHRNRLPEWPDTA